MSFSPEQIKKELEAIKPMESEFYSTYEEAIKADNPEKAKKLRSEIETRIANLKEQLNPLWRELHLKEQYESQKNILQKTGILEKLTNGELGIRRIDGKEYQFPTLEEITKRLRERKEALKPKLEQGFNKLLIVPSGMFLGKLIEKYKQAILKHHQEGKLFATKNEENEPDLPFDINIDNPLYVWEEYINADKDKDGKLVYGIKQYPPIQKNKRLPYDPARDGGRTKQELISLEGGFNILLIENLPNIPREGKGKEKAGRHQLEANKIPEDYLAMLGKDSYKEEVGMTPEDQLTYAITHLEETNQVIDDYQGKGSISYQIGAYFHVSGYVPLAYSDRGHRRASLNGVFPDYRFESVGVRSAVRI